MRRSIRVGGMVCAVVCSFAARAQTATGMPARDAAPVDLTGNWVSVVTEDWAWRMQTPPKGDYASLPLNNEGRRVADLWSEDRDGSCLAFGAVSMLRVPTRARISWEDADTLRIETDNGLQTRRLYFDANTEAPSARSLQGHSIAHWETTASGADGASPTTQIGAPRWASLKVITTGLQAAWLRPNGAPYSQDAVLTEYFDAFEDGDDSWFSVTTIVEDPTYLSEPLVISSNFKREPDGSNWNARPCKE